MRLQAVSLAILSLMAAGVSIGLLDRAIADARHFVGAFGPQATFTQLPGLIHRSHAEVLHLFVRPHGGNIIMLDADVSVLPDGHAECLAMAPVVVVATSGWECSNRQYWYAMDPAGLRGGEGRNVTLTLQRLLGTDPNSTAEEQLGRMPGSLNAKPHKLCTAQLVTVSRSFFNAARFYSLTARHTPRLTVDRAGDVSAQIPRAPAQYKASSVAHDASSLDWKACCEFWELSPHASLQDCIAAVHWRKTTAWEAYRETTAKKARDRAPSGAAPPAQPPAPSRPSGHSPGAAEPAPATPPVSTARALAAEQSGLWPAASFRRFSGDLGRIDSSPSPAAKPASNDPPRSGKAVSEGGAPPDDAGASPHRPPPPQPAGGDGASVDGAELECARGAFTCAGCGKHLAKTSFSKTQLKYGSDKRCVDCAQKARPGKGVCSGHRPRKLKQCSSCRAELGKASFARSLWLSADYESRICKGCAAKPGPPPDPADKVDEDMFESRPEALRFILTSASALPSVDIRANNAARTLHGRSQLTSIEVDGGLAVAEKLELLQKAHDEDLQHSGGADGLRRALVDAMGGWTYLDLDATFYTRRSNTFLGNWRR
ncbi:unnamed protein product [Prorocentrum cordatum]|uniref:Protein xylosyltransferase n=1 Tax=Prorocentrum cordatum TaxID=2364126 RepID=A0ABN9WUJ0_9DINO|nr:unnamed protein product [Polarella glacialis]